LGQTKIEKMIGAWIGNEASYMETELPAEIGLLDLAVLVTRRVLRGFSAGADRFCFEVDTIEPFLWECVNEIARQDASVEPASEAMYQGLWDAQDALHNEHRLVPDTAPWLKVREDATKAKLGAMLGDEDTVGDLAEVVSAGVYHLMLNGACRVLVELSRDLCVVMTPEEVSQAAVDRSFDETARPENTPLTQLRGGNAENRE
jgi:hypothetical protein